MGGHLLEVSFPSRPHIHRRECRAVAGLPAGAAPTPRADRPPGDHAVRDRLWAEDWVGIAGLVGRSKSGSRRSSTSSTAFPRMTPSGGSSRPWARRRSRPNLLPGCAASRPVCRAKSSPSTGRPCSEPAIPARRRPRSQAGFHWERQRFCAPHSRGANDSFKGRLVSSELE